MIETAKNKFGIYAEAEGHSQPLIMTEIPFGRLMDDIVVPYQTDKPFFVDGAPVTKKSLKKLKIIRLDKNFAPAFCQMHMLLHHSNTTIQKLYGEQYQIRVEALLRATEKMLHHKSLVLTTKQLSTV
jgi:hypothetical protein